MSVLWGVVLDLLRGTIQGAICPYGRVVGVTRMMRPKMGPQNFRDFVIKPDPRRFLMSYWYQSIDNFEPVLFRGVPRSF